MILAGALFLLLLPMGMRIYLQKWIMENGADSAVIEKIRFNPFAGTLAIEGATVTMEGKKVFADADIMVNLGMLALFKKQAAIQQTLLKGITLDIELYQDGRLRIGSYTIDTTKDVPSEEQIAQEDIGLSWVIRARDVVMTNCRINFRMPDLDVSLQVDDAKLVRFTTAENDKSGTFTLQGRVNGTPVLIDLSLLRILPEVVAKGRVKVDGFKLADLEPFLKPYLAPFTGLASVDGKVDYRMTLDTLDIFTDFDGTISLEDGHIAGDSFSVQGAPVRWEKGAVHFEMTEDRGIIIRTDGRLTGKNLAVDIPDPVIEIREPDLAIDGKVQVTIDDEVVVDTTAGFSLAKTTFAMPPLAAEAANIHWQGANRKVRFNSGTSERELSVQVEGELVADDPGFADRDKAVQLDVHGRSVAWNGEVSYLLGLTAKDPSLVKTRGEIKGSDLALSLGESLEYSQDKLAANGSSEVRLGSVLKAGYEGSITLDGTTLTVAAMDAAGKNLAWKGKGEFSLGTKNTMGLRLDGGLTTRELAVSLADSGLAFDQQEIKLTSKSSIQLAPDITLKGTTSLKADDLIIRDGDTKLAEIKGFGIEKIEAPGGKKISIEQATATGIETDINGEMPLKATVPSIVLSNINTEDLAVFTVDQLSMEHPQVTSVKNGKPLAGLNTLTVKKIQAGLDQKIAVKRINLDDLYFLGKSAADKKAVCRLASTRLSRLDWSPQTGSHAGSVSLADLKCRLIKEKDGTLVLNKDLAAMRIATKEKPQPKKSAKADRKNPGANIRLDQITLRGDNVLRYRDHTLEVPFKGKMIINTLQIKGLDSGRPDKPASIRLTAAMAGRAPLELTGSLAPFAESLALDLKLNLKNYPLTRLSPYTVQSVGVGLAGGQLRLDSSIKIKNNTLDMKNELQLKQLETKTISTELAAKLDNQLPIPLDSALSMLRDSEGNIKLSIPLSGKLDKLNVGVTDILITALGKAIVPAASGYLMYTLGPYGALAWVGMKVGEKMLEVKLPPVNFAPGSDELPEGIDDYFKRLAKILQDKPTEDLQLCPRSSAWEFSSEAEIKEGSEKDLELSKSERKKLRKLGQRRAENIKEHLMSNYSIDKDRLLICVTRIESKKSAKPRVDIRM